MGVYDYFKPNPEIQCPNCGEAMEGWQGKHWGNCCFFVWKQSEIAPVVQEVSTDIRLNNIELSKMRLEKVLIPISGGECKNCKTQWRDSQFHVSADARAGTWTETLIDPVPLIGTILDAEWIQCSNCANAYEIKPGQTWIVCEPCGRLVKRPS